MLVVLVVLGGGGGGLTLSKSNKSSFSFPLSELSELSSESLLTGMEVEFGGVLEGGGEDGKKGALSLLEAVEEVG